MPDTLPRIGLGAGTLALGRVMESNFPSGRMVADALIYTRQLTEAFGAAQIDIFVPARHHQRFMTWLIRQEFLAYITARPVKGGPPGLLARNIVAYYPQAGNANTKAVERELSVYADSELSVVGAMTGVTQRLAFRPDLRNYGRSPMPEAPYTVVHDGWSDLYAKLTAPVPSVRR
jgi:hypothetical protein